MSGEEDFQEGVCGNDDGRGAPANAALLCFRRLRATDGSTSRASKR